MTQSKFELRTSFTPQNISCNSLELNASPWFSMRKPRMRFSYPSTGNVALLPLDFSHRTMPLTLSRVTLRHLTTGSAMSSGILLRCLSSLSDSSVIVAVLAM